MAEGKSLSLGGNVEMLTRIMKESSLADDNLLLCDS